MAQTNPYPATDDGLPYGGVAVTPGSNGPIGPPDITPPGQPDSAPPPNGTTTICETGGVVDPCVLTAQNSRWRTSANTFETNLAGFDSTSASTFGMAAFYQLATTDHPTGYGYTPAMTQPLYITNVPSIGGSGTVDLVIGANLNNTVYAWNTGTGAQVWSRHLADCGAGPFINNQNRVPGAAQLPYYGIVSTPVIDVTPAPPVLFVVYACSTSNVTYQWWLDAIDVKNGDLLNSQQITDANFKPYNELSRAALLLTHPTSTQTDVYVAFAAGIRETEAGDGSSYSYSGVVFGYSITYSRTSPYVTYTELNSSGTPPAIAPFYDSGTTTASFPTAYTGFNTTGGPTGPSCVTSTGGNYCDQGDNWAVNGGGIWMSAKGPASDASANVYVTSGNGPFGCLPTGNSTCVSTSSVYNWGESAVKLPAATSTSMGTPSDFYTPNFNNLKNIKSGIDPSPATYQFQELNRLDQDFGTPGLVLMPHAGSYAFAATADKSGYLYVMGTGGSGLGMFQTSDTGLVQSPFQANRYPSTLNTTPCPVQNTSPAGTFSGPSCDEIHELAWWHDFLYLWPEGETLLGYTGTVGGGGTTYTFGSKWDPCVADPTNCGTAPKFPVANYPGASVAIAANGSTGSAATLWATVPQNNAATPPNPQAGTLYAYTVNSDGTLTYVWNSVTAQHCSAPPVAAWFAPSFAEPTLANGAAYLSTYCATTGTGGPYTGCAAAAGSAAVSGIIVYAQCP